MELEESVGEVGEGGVTLESNTRVLRLLRRREFCRLTGDCDRCPPHRGENWERAPRKSWKFRSKKRKAYA